MHRFKDPLLAAGLVAFLKQFPDGLDFDDIPFARREFEKYTATLVAEAARLAPGVTTEDHQTPGLGGAPEVRVRTYRPSQATDVLPALLWIHGGGHVLGSVEQEELTARRLSLDLDCVVAAVDYRLAPEHPFPQGLEDCFAALTWLAEDAERLGVEATRIAVGGASSGGGMAAGLGLLNRDRGGVDVCHQLLLYPMLDDANVQQVGPGVPDTPPWNRKSNLASWRAYLNASPGGKGVPAYAAAVRAEDLSGLPPTFLAVGSLDLFRDETIVYADRLMQAGVPTELHVYAEGYHAFDLFAPNADISKRLKAAYAHCLKRALHG